MKEITFPARTGGTAENPFGLAEYLIDNVFSRRDLYADPGFCEMVVKLQPKIKALLGPKQDGAKLKLSDSHHGILVQHALPHANAQVLPEGQFFVAQCRLAITRAVDVDEDKSDEKPAAAAAPAEQANGKPKKNVAQV